MLALLAVVVLSIRLAIEPRRRRLFGIALEGITVATAACRSTPEARPLSDRYVGKNSAEKFLFTAVFHPQPVRPRRQTTLDTPYYRTFAVAEIGEHTVLGIEDRALLIKAHTAPEFTRTGTVGDDFEAVGAHGTQAFLTLDGLDHETHAEA